MIDNGVLGPGTLPPNEESSRGLTIRTVGPARCLRPLRPA